MDVHGPHQLPRSCNDRHLLSPPPADLHVEPRYGRVAPLGVDAGELDDDSVQHGVPCAAEDVLRVSRLAHPSAPLGLSAHCTYSWLF
jgi:hypothetical protein